VACDQGNEVLLNLTQVAAEGGDCTPAGNHHKSSEASPWPVVVWGGLVSAPGNRNWARIPSRPVIADPVSSVGSIDAVRENEILPATRLRVIPHHGVNELLRCIRQVRRGREVVCQRVDDFLLQEDCLRSVDAGHG